MATSGMQTVKGDVVLQRVGSSCEIQEDEKPLEAEICSQVEVVG